MCAYLWGTGWSRLRCPLSPWKGPGLHTPQALKDTVRFRSKQVLLSWKRESSVRPQARHPSLKLTGLKRHHTVSMLSLATDAPKYIPTTEALLVPVKSLSTTLSNDIIMVLWHLRPLPDSLIPGTCQPLQGGTMPALHVLSASSHPLHAPPTGGARQPPET